LQLIQFYQAAIAKKGKFMKIDPKHTGILTVLIIVSVMSFIMSFVMAAINVGFTDFFVFAWLRGWLMSWLVGFPIAGIVIPFARRIVSRLMGQEAH
jgi:uncharacterized integral membrane protein